MSVNITESYGGRTLEIQVTGKLHKEDYEQFVPKTEALIRARGKLRLLVELVGFHGWDAGALWEDLKFDLKHFNDIERLAIVGEKRWQERMSKFCGPFTTAEVRYFPASERNAAKAWIAEKRENAATP